MNEFKQQNGQSLVEMAIGSVVLLILLLGLVDLGRAFVSQIALREAAQEGVFYASLHPGDLSGIVSAVRTSSTSPVDLSDISRVVITINFLPNGDQCASLDPNVINDVTVTLDYTFDLQAPLVTNIVGGENLNIGATMVATILSPAC